jgi:hypothetical protein
MTYNYAGITKSATALITKFGKEYTFTRTTDGSYDPTTGTTSQTTATFNKFSCVFDYNEQDLANSAILQDDKRMLVESHDFLVGDKVVIGSDTYQVISVSPIQPGDDIVAANLQVRK